MAVRRILLRIIPKKEYICSRIRVLCPQDPMEVGTKVAIINEAESSLYKKGVDCLPVRTECKPKKLHYEKDSFILGRSCNGYDDGRLLGCIL